MSDNNFSPDAFERWKLPSGWLWERAGNICEVVGGGTPKSDDGSNFTDEKNGVPWLTPADLSDHREVFISGGSRFLSQKGLVGSSAKLLPTNTVLFSSRAPIGYVAVATRPVATNQGFKSFICGQAIEPKFLYYYLRRSKSLIEGMASGTTFLEISGGRAKEIPVPIAPLKEQKRIVAKLDELLPRVEACKQRLEKIPAILKRFRQSVLAAAASGRLTEDWRKKTKKEVDTQQRIQDLKDARMSLADKSEVGLVHGWYSEVRLSEENRGWIILPAGAICDFITKGTTPKAEEITDTGEIPFLKVYHIVENRLNFLYKPSFVARHIHEGFLRRSRVFPGDVLMNIVGPPLNKAAVVPNDFPEWNVNQALAIFRPIKGVLPQYLQLLLCQEAIFGEMIRETRGIVGQVNISLEQCRNIQIPLPPLEEQIEIVRVVGELIARNSKQLSAVEKALLHCTKAEDAILGKAFAGQLVIQDSTDEPAEVLLKKIQSQHQANNGSGTKQKGKATISKRRSSLATSEVEQ